MQPRSDDVNAIKLGVIYGSARDGRFCDIVVAWLRRELAQWPDLVVDEIDPIAPARIPEVVADADAFIVVTPEYNHGYPSALKALIDSFPTQWQAKPVAFVSYGGISGGLRAVEQLRLVFAELHAVTLRDGVSFANAWERFDSHGNLRAPERARRSTVTMMQRLRWWALALRRARAQVPYAATGS
jgi:NAD(P)H-dependent FMN reductase